MRDVRNKNVTGFNLKSQNRNYKHLGATTDESEDEYDDL